MEKSVCSVLPWFETAALADLYSLKKMFPESVNIHEYANLKTSK